MRLHLSPVAVALLLGASACVSPARINRAAGQLDLGTAYYREGNFEGAVDTLRGAVKLDPRNWRAWDNLAIAYIAKGDNEQAQEAFDRALKIDPDEGEILLNYGAWLMNVGRTDDAIAAFVHAGKDVDYRNQSMVLSNLSAAYLTVGRNDDALASAREAVRRSPDLCEGWFHLGLAQEARGDVPAALEAYDNLIHRCPKESSGALLRTGCLQVKGADPESGTDALQRVLRTEPGTHLADEARLCLNEGAR